MAGAYEGEGKSAEEGSKEPDESSGARAGWYSNSGVIEKSRYQHTRACPSDIDE